MKRTILILLTAYCLLTTLQAADKRPMTVEDMFRVKRVADPQISPDGKLVAYVVTTVDLANNSTNADIWLATTDGKSRRQLTSSPKADRHPRWSPDGKKILFESGRSGSGQLWVIHLDGGEAQQVTDIATEASTGIWSPDGEWIAFVSAVYPEFSAQPYVESNANNKKKADEIAKNPVKAKTFTKLFYRHWDSYVEDKRQHLFVMQAPLLTQRTIEPKNITPGDRDAYPTSTTFSVGDDFTFSPDSKYLVFTAPPSGKDEAWNTNHDIWRVPINGGKFENLTEDNKAADSAPRFSRDGKMMAYRAQRKPGYEADKWELMVMDADGRGRPRSMTAKLDRSVDSFVMGPDNDAILFTAEENAGSVMYVAIVDQNPRVNKVLEGNHNSSVTLSNDGKTWAFQRAAMDHPADVFVREFKHEKARNVSRANQEVMAELDLPRPESVTVSGAGGTPMQMWILKPPGFNPNRKWPLVYLVHGGPQGAWEDNWSYRWNAQVWAARGYVVALPNPRGSTGFGQKYVDEISGDWGGKCYTDLMAGLEFLEKQPYIDRNRMAAAGASFGGYMVNWFQGHTTKFKTLITHCGVYNFDSMYALTEELWFDEWEHGGPPWVNRHSYEEFSPHRFAKNFKTPMLIIHNDLDFRVPVSEGHQLFTTLQRLGVPARFVNFPDEGHWVLKPANSNHWHKEVFTWLAKYVPPGAK